MPGLEMSFNLSRTEHRFSAVDGMPDVGIGIPGRSLS